MAEPGKKRRNGAGSPCIYIYKEGDEAVKSGRKKVGDRCKSFGGKQEWGRLCLGHAKAAGLADAKYRAGKERKQYTSNKNEDPGIFTEILPFFGAEFNAEKVLSDFRLMTNDGPTTIAQNVFLLWEHALPGNRKPESALRLAEILQVSYQVLLSWRTTRWYRDTIKRFNQFDFARMVPLVDKAIAASAIKGSTTAQKLFRERAEVMLGSDSGEKQARLPKSLIDELPGKRDGEEGEVDEVVPGTETLLEQLQRKRGE